MSDDLDPITPVRPPRPGLLSIYPYPLNNLVIEINTGSGFVVSTITITDSGDHYITPIIVDTSVRVSADGYDTAEITVESTPATVVLEPAKPEYLYAWTDPNADNIYDEDWMIIPERCPTIGEWVGLEYVIYDYTPIRSIVYDGNKFLVAMHDGEVFYTNDINADTSWEENNVTGILEDDLGLSFDQDRDTYLYRLAYSHKNNKYALFSNKLSNPNVCELDDLFSPSSIVTKNIDGYDASGDLYYAAGINDLRVNCEYGMLQSWAGPLALYRITDETAETDGDPISDIYDNMSYYISFSNYLNHYFVLYPGGKLGYTNSIDEMFTPEGGSVGGVQIIATLPELSAGNYYSSMCVTSDKIVAGTEDGKIYYAPITYIPATLYTDSTTLTTGMTLYDNTGTDTGYKVGTISGNSFELQKNTITITLIVQHMAGAMYGAGSGTVNSVSFTSDGSSITPNTIEVNAGESCTITALNGKNSDPNGSPYETFIHLNDTQVASHLGTATYTFTPTEDCTIGINFGIEKSGTVEI